MSRIRVRGGGAGGPEGKKVFGKARHRWGYHIERDLK